MAAVETPNGALSPPVVAAPPSNSTPADSTNKRKREDEDRAQLKRNTARDNQRQQDILAVIKEHDSTPSLLNFDGDRDGSREPSSKKARFSDPNATSSTISAKLSNSEYTSLRALREDVAKTTKVLVESVRAKSKDEQGRVSVDDLKVVQRVEAFSSLVNRVVESEEQHDALDIVREAKTANGAKTGASQSGTVLTLFGNAPNPKQLFSSMQNSQANRDPAIKDELPVEEMSLPNGLSASRIIPPPVEDNRKAPTFEELFTPPTSLSSFNPPKAHKRSTTRDTSITWEFKEQPTKSKKGGYTVQNQTVGTWLGYGGLDSGNDATSPREKRKQRDRALSSGESTQPPPPKASPEETMAKEEEALFRRAYSSFAPSCDNTKSLVPEETKNLLWWQKVGDKRFKELFAIDPALLEDQSEADASIVEAQEGAKEDTDFTSLIEDLESLDDEGYDTKPTQSKTDVDQILREISELLETLASHQRIRNVSLPTATAGSRVPISPAPLLAARIGRPDSPAEDEMSTYESLRRELAFLILQLPPYAVAKLNGDQLSELGVSQLITFEGKNIKGTMEEDQVARLAKHNAMNSAAAAPAGLPRSNSTAGQHYSTTAQRTPAIGQAANTRYGQTPQYGAQRTPSVPNTAQQFARRVPPPAGTPGSAARPGYGGQPQVNYSQFAAGRPSFSQSNGQQPGTPQQQQYYNQQQQRPQQPAGGYGGYAQQYNNQPASSSQPLAQFQQRAQIQNAASYQNNAAAAQSASPFNRTASPAKPEYMQQQQAAPTSGQRPSFSAQPAGSATPNYPSQPPTPVNGYQAGTPSQSQAQPSMPRPASATTQPAQAQSVEQNGHA